MALVPGLRGGLQEKPDLERNTGRVGLQSDGVPRMPKLRPAASPIETYTRPGALPKDNDAERLMAALAPLNSALLGFGEVMKGEQKDKHAASNAWLATHSAEDARKELRDNPTGELATSLREEKGQELFAAKMAQDDVTRWQEEWATGPKDGVDVEEFLRSRVEGRMKEHGGTGSRFVNEYLRLVRPGMDGIRNGQLKHNVQKADEQVSQGALALIERTIANGKAEGKNADDIVSLVRGEITGNKLLAGRDASWQEGEVLNIAMRYAEQGDVDFVTALVKSKGANGISLLGNREHGLKATKLLELADSKRREKNREGGYETMDRLDRASRDGTLDAAEVDRLVKERPGLMSDERALALKARSNAEIEKRLNEQQKLFRDQSNREAADRGDIRNRDARLAAVNDGNLHRLGPTIQAKENGEIEEISAEKNKEKATEQWLEVSDKVAARNRETPEQRFARELPAVRQNGMVHPEWKSTMSAGIKTVSAVTTSGDKLPAAFVEGYNRYTELYTRAPALLNSHLSKDERERWETMRVMVQEVGMDPSKAALQFTTMSKDPVKFRELLGEGTRQELLESVDREFRGATNKGHILQAIHKRSFVFAGAGLSSKDAIKRATDEYKRTHQQINGHYIDVSDRALPPDFADLAKTHIDEYVRKHGKREFLDAGDITLEPAVEGTGAWVLRNTHTGGILDDANDRIVTIDTLMKIKTAREDAKRRVIAEKQEEVQKRLNGPADPGRDTRQLPVIQVTPLPEPGIVERRKANEAKGDPVADFVKGTFWGAVDTIKNGVTTEADAPEAVPPGGRYRDIVRGN
ncbi:hypothetical protein FG93_03499 [Bosea sp. LC85]|uniref:hypothetical protein n=1 Tax=Bosea sp. LC85 TaxID=1502851 RepID=UPI0004E444A1|nr:hypothetical protein [Bosea sp. LC85]KFC68877.1 hypothetical protein FG93_03499 [Bosea sp. LC85]